jgi:hypothetical protein
MAKALSRISFFMMVEIVAFRQVLASQNSEAQRPLPAAAISR